jgi:hypothetical protein
MYAMGLLAQWESVFLVYVDSRLSFPLAIITIYVCMYMVCGMYIYVVYYAYVWVYMLSCTCIYYVQIHVFSHIHQSSLYDSVSCLPYCVILLISSLLCIPK